MTTIAFIGLGNMGIGMASNLAKAGHEVRALDISEEAVARAVEAGCVGVKISCSDVSLSGSSASAVASIRESSTSALSTKGVAVCWSVSGSACWSD